jgi:hypothetical protein
VVVSGAYGPTLPALALNTARESRTAQTTAQSTDQSSFARQFGEDGRPPGSGRATATTTGNDFAAGRTSTRPTTGIERSGSGRTEGDDGSERDRVSISARARELFESAREDDESGQPGVGSTAPDGRELTTEEQQQVRELQARDREVRQHEQAHLAAAGELASGGPTYTYQTGPDGRRYAVGGEVQIQLREGNDARETLENAQRAKRAALAPAEPSGQDRRVAAQADQLANQARRDLAEERRTERDPESESSADAPRSTGDPAGVTSDAIETSRNDRSGTRRGTDAAPTDSGSFASTNSGGSSQRIASLERSAGAEDRVTLPRLNVIA